MPNRATLSLSKLTSWLNALTTNRSGIKASDRKQPIYSLKNTSDWYFLSSLTENKNLPKGFQQNVCYQKSYYQIGALPKSLLPNIAVTKKFCYQIDLLPKCTSYQIGALPNLLQPHGFHGPPKFKLVCIRKIWRQMKNSQK